MKKVINVLICSFIIFFVFRAVGFTNELTLATTIVCSFAFGYGLHMVWGYTENLKGILNESYQNSSLQIKNECKCY